MHGSVPFLARSDRWELNVVAHSATVATVGIAPAAGRTYPEAIALTTAKTTILRINGAMVGA